VVARRLEGKVEPIFHPDSYGYRPGRSALDAIAVCRQRCWKHDWVIDLDVQKFFDSVRWDLVIKAVPAHTDADTRWIVLCVIPEGAGTVKSFDEGSVRGACCLTLPFLVAGVDQPADGVMVERPQRSEDERPWGRRRADRRIGRRDGIAWVGPP
jgi:hypothetical protein